MLLIVFLCPSLMYSQDDAFSQAFKKVKEISIQSYGLNIGSLWSIVTGLDNSIIVLDVKGRQVLAFSQEGSFLKKIGENGQGPGEYQNPSTLMSDRNGNIYIGDHNTRRINIYDPTGEFSSSFISTSAHWPAISLESDSKGDLYLGGLALDPSGTVPGTLINKYTKEGKYIRSFYRDNAEQDWVRMIAYFDFDIFDDVIYAVKPNIYKISIFGLSGEPIRSIGKKPPYIKELDSGIKLDPNKFKGSTDAREKLLAISKTWNKIMRVSHASKEHLLLFIETNGLISGISTKYVIDVIDTNGNLVHAKIPTDYKFLYADSNNMLHFLIYSDEEEALERDPQYKIGIFRFFQEQ